MHYCGCWQPLETKRQEELHLKSRINGLLGQTNPIQIDNPMVKYKTDTQQHNLLYNHDVFVLMHIVSNVAIIEVKKNSSLHNLFHLEHIDVHALKCKNHWCDDI